MKLLNDEGSKIYVQVKDILYLLSFKEYEQFILIKMLEYKIDVNNNIDDNDYLEFTNEEEIKYFQDLEYIIDYNNYSNLTLNELVDKWQEADDKFSVFISNSDKKNSRNYDYMRANISELHQLKRKSKLPILPLFDVKEKPKKGFTKIMKKIKNKNLS